MYSRNAGTPFLLPLSLSLLVLVFVAPCAAAAGQEEETPDETAVTAHEGAAEGAGTLDEDRLQERVTVIGSPEAVDQISGAAQFIGPEELERQRYSDIHRVLRRAPGVYLQDEEGYGLRPNIGMRGTGVERSQKVTLMEDGVLIAPAPYAAPSAYYFPTAGRMESMEISKGPSSIRQGPQTNGGVLNLLSHSIPNRFGGDAELTLGEDSHVRAKARVGDSTDRFGWLVEGYHQETDGFKQLDGGGDTGFELDDYVGKFRVNSRPGARFYQSLELKLGTTDQLGQETYLGLTQEDFDRNPSRRYVASSEDFITTDHDQYQLRYFFVPRPNLDLTATVYRNDLFRNWHKLQSVDGVKASAVLDDPATYAGELAILRGETDSAADSLAIRNNRREYYSQGIQSVLGWRVDHAGAGHEFEFGVRIHEDEEDRFQEEDGYRILNGRMEQTSLGDPGSQSNRVSRAEALALFLRDRISLGRWTVTPGVRYEAIDYTRRDYGKTDPERTGDAATTIENDVREVIPGVGVDFVVNPEWRVFGGIHKGFSPPGPGQTEDTDPEESINYELGVRLRKEATRFQAVGFFNDYDNLLGTDTLSGGGEGTGDRYNGGEVAVYGVELSFDTDLARGRFAGMSFPLNVAYTYSRGEFRSSFETDFADWAPEVQRGDELPYLPEHQLFAEIGWRAPHWGVFVTGSLVDETRTHAGQGTIPDDESLGSHVLFDLSAERTFRSQLRTFVQVRNVTDEVYVAARRPAGLRPGLPRTVLAGVGFRF